MKALSDFIVTVPGLLPAGLCQALIETSGELNPALVEGGVTHPARNCSQKRFKNEDLDLYLAQAVMEYRKLFGDCKVTDFTGLVFLRYETGQFYRQHVDSFPGKPRLLTISIALNDDFEGGEWAWFDRAVVKRFKVGDAVLFPSNFMFPHEILPVVSGTRYAVITWFTE